MPRLQEREEKRVYKVVIKQKSHSINGYEFDNEIVLHKEVLRDALYLIESIIEGQNDIEFTLKKED